MKESGKDGDAPSERGEGKALGELRTRIREVDRKIIDLVAERLSIAAEIGERKKSVGLPLRDYKVEASVINSIVEAAGKMGLEVELAEELARVLIKGAVRRQEVVSFSPSEGREEGVVTAVIGANGGMGRWFSEYFLSSGHKVVRLDKEEFHDKNYLTSVLSEADYVAVCVGITETYGVMERIIEIGTSGLLFDICSLKNHLLPLIKEGTARGMRMASVHPMFGPAARLLSDKNILICKTGGKGDDEAASLFRATAANLVKIPIELHDSYILYVLGLAHFINLVFSDIITGSGMDPKTLRSIGGTTFKKQLEVAHEVVSENPRLYYEIQKINNLSPNLYDKMRFSLERIAGFVTQDDFSAFREVMENALSFFGSYRSSL